MTKFLQKKNSFWLNVNMHGFLDKKILNIKMYFCNISATTTLTLQSKLKRSFFAESLKKIKN